MFKTSLCFQAFYKTHFHSTLGTIGTIGTISSFGAGASSKATTAGISTVIFFLLNAPGTYTQLMLIYSYLFLTL
jgi:hypothetical protein